MSNIEYKIKFYSYWHCGSGLAAGASMDAIVVKDSDGLPFVPGRTIKGLVREAIEEYFDGDKNKDVINKMFGTEANGKQENTSKQGESFFSNATLPQKERQRIIEKKWQRFLYDTIASTAIDDNQTAKESSLRTMEVVIPCELQGEILNVDDSLVEKNDSLVEKVTQAMRMIKRLGVDRNRGLGRCDFCDFIITKKEDTNDDKATI